MSMVSGPMQQRVSRRGFTLLEALMASGILLGIVVAVTSAVTAGQQHAFEAQQRIAGTLAAEDLMGRLTTVSYAMLPTWNGYTEPVGEMVDMAGNPLPESFASVGRAVQVASSTQMFNDLGVVINGREVRVRAFDNGNRTLAELIRFIPEPPSP